MIEASRFHPEQPHTVAVNFSDYEHMRATDPGKQGEITPPTDGMLPQSGGYPVESASEPVEVTEAPRQVRIPRSTLPALPLAEEIDPQAFRERLAVMRTDDTVKSRMETASVLSELALATPDDGEAQASLDEAEEVYSHILAGMDPDSGAGLRVSRAASFIPVMRMRREHADLGDMADTAYDALTQSLSQALPQVERYGMPRLVPADLLDFMAEDAIAALVARDGLVPHLSSDRERYRVRPAGGFTKVSDFHLIESDQRKLSLRTRFDDSSSHHVGADPNMPLVIIRYIPDVCRVVADKLRTDDAWLTPEQEARMTVDLSRRLVSESNGAPLPPIVVNQRYHDPIHVINQAQRAVFRKIRDWHLRHPR